MRILITSSRAPVALHLIRAFGKAGHTVYATDTVPWTLGSHSRYLTQHFVTPPPRYAPLAFAQSLAQISQQHQIDVLIPTCEEVFYVAMHHGLLNRYTRVCCDPLPVLAHWHNKYTFAHHAAALGLLTPQTTLVQTSEELHAALATTPRYLLKPAYSRFATQIITNCGSRRRERPITDCIPTPEQPWLVQEFIYGETLCSYSTLHNGHVTAHCAYRTPHQAGGGSGTAFVSLDGHETLAIVQRLGAAVGYTGQLSFDYMCAPDGQLYLLECNPRATSGLHLLTPERLVDGLLDSQQPTWVEPEGRHAQLALVVLSNCLTDIIRHPQERGRWAKLLEAIGDTTRVGDVIISPSDPLPALTQLVQVAHVLGVSQRRGVSVLEATTDDIEWNGDGDLQPTNA